MNSDIIVTYKNTNEEEYKYDIWICKGKYKRTESWKTDKSIIRLWERFKER